MDFGWEVEFGDGGWEGALGCHHRGLMHIRGQRVAVTISE